MPVERPFGPCPLCGTREVRFRSRDGDWRYGMPGEFSVLQCSRCEILFTAPPEPAEVAQFYALAYG